MNLKDLREALKGFQTSGTTSEQLNRIRKDIFDSYDNGDIRSISKVDLLKELYKIATIKGIYFIKVMERVQGLPKTDEEEASLAEEEESYEESYSYEDEDEEEDEEEESK